MMALALLWRRGDALGRRRRPSAWHYSARRASMGWIAAARTAG